MTIYTNEKMLAWFMSCPQNGRKTRKHNTNQKSASTRIRELTQKNITLFGANEYEIAKNLFEDFKAELTDLLFALEKKPPIFSTLRTDDKLRNKYIQQLKEILAGENLLQHSIENLNETLNKVNDLLVTPFILLPEDDLNIISFSHSALTRITPKIANILQSNSKLQYIDFNDNNIRHIPKGCFDNLTNLISLRLNNNKLTRLDKDVFQNLDSILLLSLDNNKCGYIHPSNKDVLKRTNNNILLNPEQLKKPFLYSLIRNHSAKFAAAITFSLVLPLASYLLLSGLAVSALLGVGLAAISHHFTNKIISNIDNQRNRKGLLPEEINEEAKNIAKAASDNIVSEALSWISPKAYQYYDSYCFGLREQQYGSFQPQEEKPTHSYNLRSKR